MTWIIIVQINLISLASSAFFQHLCFRGIIAELINTASSLPLLLMSDYCLVIKGEILFPLRHLCSLQQHSDCACVLSVTQQKQLLLWFENHWPSQSSEHPSSQIWSPDSHLHAAEKKDPVTSWQPSLSTCRFISSRLSSNKLECWETPRKTKPCPSVAQLPPVAVLARNAFIILCICIFRLIPVWCAALVSWRNGFSNDEKWKWKLHFCCCDSHCARGHFWNLYF